jgi:hypothetical protein
LEIEIDARAGIAGDPVSRHLNVEHRLPSIRRADVKACSAPAGQGVSPDAQPDRAEDRDHVSLRPAQCAVRYRDPSRHRSCTGHARSDQDIRQRRAVDREVTERRLVAEDGDAVHALSLRHADPKPADADAHG